MDRNVRRVDPSIREQVALMHEEIDAAVERYMGSFIMFSELIEYIERAAKRQQGIPEEADLSDKDRGSLRKLYNSIVRASLSFTHEEENGEVSHYVKESLLEIGRMKNKGAGDSVSSYAVAHLHLRMTKPHQELLAQALGELVKTRTVSSFSKGVLRK